MTATQPAKPAVAAQRLRVLVVEDNEDARAMLTVLLRHNGYDVRAVADGPAAIAEAETFAPEVVLLDVGLRALDGYAVACELRAQLALPMYRSSRSPDMARQTIANERSPRGAITTFSSRRIRRRCWR